MGYQYILIAIGSFIDERKRFVGVDQGIGDSQVGGTVYGAVCICRENIYIWTRLKYSRNGVRDINIVSLADGIVRVCFIVAIRVCTARVDCPILRTNDLLEVADAIVFLSGNGLLDPISLVVTPGGKVPADTTPAKAKEQTNIAKNRHTASLVTDDVLLLLIDPLSFSCFDNLHFNQGFKNNLLTVPRKALLIKVRGTTNWPHP